MDRFKIYLGGKMTGLNFEEMNNWREELKKNLIRATSFCYYSLQVINPIDYYNFEEKRHKTEKEVMNYDLRHVLSSDMLIVNLKDINTSIGTAIECWEAKKANIPVLAFGTDEVHPWILECIDRIEKDEKALINYIVDFYCY